jgi:hypothetical protein
VIEVAGWAFAPSRSKVKEIRLTIGGETIQTCTPTLSRPDVAAHFKNPEAELSGFSCAGRLPSNATSLAAAALRVSYVTNDDQSFMIFNGRVGSVLT